MSDDRIKKLEERVTKLERRDRITRLYAVLESAWDGIYLRKEFEGNLPGLYCPYCLKAHDSLEALESKASDFGDTTNAHCPKCRRNIKAQKQSGLNPLSPPDDL